MSKTIALFFALSFFCNKLDAQQDVVTYAIVNDFATYGYVNGVRLDSVAAQYAEMKRRPDNQCSFDFGQMGSESKTKILTDRNGNPLYFTNKNTAFLLNFYYFNGWSISESEHVQTGMRISYLLEKNKK